MFEKRMLRKIFWPKCDKATGEWRTVRDELLHDFYSSSNITRENEIKKN
jgi:hypothetical protein